MSVATASKEAYGRMRSVPPKEHPVYKFLKTFGTGTAGYSNRQIAAIMGRPINTITPRIFELREAGVVVLAGKRKDTYSGIEVSHWRIATAAEEAAYKAFTTPPVLTDEEIAKLPRTWLHLADIPEGVIVKETTGAGWHWLRRANGDFGHRTANVEDTTFGGWLPLGRQEHFYGPMVEVLA
jgi:hypothetical protein